MDRILGKDDSVIEIRGEQYKIGSIKIGLVGSLINYFKDRPLQKVFKQKREENLDMETFKFLHAEAKREASKFDIDPEQMMQMVFSKENMDIDLIIHFLWLILSNKNPQIKKSFVEDLEIDELTGIISLMQGISPEESEKKNQVE